MTACWPLLTGEPRHPPSIKLGRDVLVDMNAVLGRRFPTVCALAGIKEIRSNQTAGVPPLDGHDVFEAVTTGATSPRLEHVYNIDCAAPKSAMSCAESGQEVTGAMRDAAGLKVRDCRDRTTFSGSV